MRPQSSFSSRATSTNATSRSAPTSVQTNHLYKSDTHLPSPVQTGRTSLPTSKKLHLSCPVKLPPTRPGPVSIAVVDHFCEYMRRKVRVVDHIASACAEKSAAAARSRGSENDFSDAQASDAHTSVVLLVVSCCGDKLWYARTGGAAERPGPPYGVLRTRRRYALRSHPRTDRTLLSAPYERVCVAVSFQKRSSRPRRAEVDRTNAAFLLAAFLLLEKGCAILPSLAFPTRVPTVAPPVPRLEE